MPDVAYLQGIVLGFALITPIGAQNLFILNEGLRAGLPQVLLPAVIAAVCDSSLIVLGAAGASMVLARAPQLRGFLIAAGAVFLVALGVRELRTRPQILEAQGERGRRRAVVFQTIGVSLLNPHAILDTVGVIGGSIAGKMSSAQLPIALGAISASWLWFLGLGASASIFQARLTPTARLWIQRASAIFMLAFATLLTAELIRLLR